MGNERVQVALCATTDDEVKNKTEKALLRAEIAYLLKCEKIKNAEHKQRKVVFYIESGQINRAKNIVEVLREEASELEVMYEV